MSGDQLSVSYIQFMIVNSLEFVAKTHCLTCTAAIDRFKCLCDNYKLLITVQTIALSAFFHKTPLTLFTCFYLLVCRNKFSCVLHGVSLPYAALI